MKRKIILFILVVLLVFSGTVLAEENLNEEEEGQGEEPVVRINDEKLADYEKAKDFGFRGGGGPQLGVLALDIDDLNDIIKDDFGQFDDHMILLGGGGLGGSKSGSRFGGYGLSGTVKTTNG